MSTIKNLFLHYWKKDKYTVAQVRSVTKEVGTTKKFSYEEFYSLTGITVEEYDANVEKYENLVCSDLIEMGLLPEDYIAK